MKVVPKITFFFLLIIINISFIYCSKDERINQDSIPYTRIYADIDLRTNRELYSNNTPIFLNEYRNIALGYKGHGIFVSKINSDSYIAFDRTCPNHGNDYTNILHYNKGDFFYHCTKCGIRYNFTNGYATEDVNPNKSNKIIIPKLQEYNAYLINSFTLRIRNNQ